MTAWEIDMDQEQTNPGADNLERISIEPPLMLPGLLASLTLFSF